MKVKNICLAIALSSLFTLPLIAETEVKEETVQKETETTPQVQIALLLDTSSSMDGLIDQAKTQLWKIVNSFSKIEKGEKTPRIQVALYEYGNSGLSIEEDYIRQISPLTEELDEISEQLFSLKTNGGSEFCGAVIQKSLNDLKWSPSSEVYKAIFISGNEPFTQGSVSATKACQRAISEGVIINTIHCGPENQGISGGWKAGAIAAEGDFLIIDQDQAISHIPAPQDKIIIELSGKLNTTYIPYGTRGTAKLTNQSVQDQNAYKEAKKGASVNRALTKCSPLYSNTSWDMVDLCQNAPEKLKELKKEELPAEMREMDLKEQQAYINQKQKERKQIQEQINTLNKEREAFLTQEKEKQASGSEGVDTLDQAITKVILSQVVKNGYKVKN